MSICITFTEYSEPFCRVKNIRKIIDTSGYGGWVGTISSPMMVSSNSVSIPNYTNSSAVDDKHYSIEMLDGTIYKFNEEEIHQLIEQLFNDVSFEDAMTVIGI
jgi:hypothetical protein